MTVPVPFNEPGLKSQIGWYREPFVPIDERLLILGRLFKREKVFPVPIKGVSLETNIGWYRGKKFRPFPGTAFFCQKRPLFKEKEVKQVLGIPDPQIWLVYLLCIVSSALCVIYGTINWNKDV